MPKGPHIYRLLKQLLGLGREQRRIRDRTVVDRREAEAKQFSFWID